jgi:uncharacterized membrane protein
MAKSKGHTIQWSKVKDTQYNDQKKRTHNTMNKSKRHTKQTLYCVSFTFDHCIVCPLLLIIVLCVLYFWPLYCVSFTFDHCIVCPLLLIIVLCVIYFWSLYCVSFTFGHCIVCLLLLAIVVKDIQYNG